MNRAEPVDDALPGEHELIVEFAGVSEVREWGACPGSSAPAIYSHAIGASASPKTPCTPGSSPLTMWRCSTPPTDRRLQQDW